MAESSLAVALRFGDVGVRVAFSCPTAATGLLPALAHARDDTLAAEDLDAGITVRRQVGDVGELTWWERAAPLRIALSRVLGADNRQVVHASVVGDDRGAVAVVGPRGSGKTTAALAAVHGGFGFVADDYVLLRTEPRAQAICLYSTACIRTRSSDHAKRVIDVGSVHADALRRALPLLAVVAPRVCGGRTRRHRIAAPAALRAWAPTTAVLMTGQHGAAIPLLATVVRSLPCYALDVGDDPRDIAEAVHEIFDAAQSQP